MTIMGNRNAVPPKDSTPKPDPHEQLAPIAPTGVDLVALPAAEANKNRRVGHRMRGTKQRNFGIADQRKLTAYRLACEGNLTWEQIAEQTGYKNANSAYRAADEIRRRNLDSTLRETRSLFFARQEDRYALAMQKARSPGFKHAANGSLVIGPDGLPLPDNTVAVQALDAANRIEQQSARMLGIDKPADLAISEQERQRVITAITELHRELSRVAQEDSRGEVIARLRELANADPGADVGMLLARLESASGDVVEAELAE